MAETDAEAGAGWVGQRLDGMNATGIGKIVGVIGAEGDSGWLVVRVGRLGRPTAVPAGDAVNGAGAVWVPYARDVIKAAPRIDARGELGADDERRLRDHYEIG